MDALPTIPSRAVTTQKDNTSPSVASMPTFKTASQRSFPQSQHKEAAPPCVTVMASHHPLGSLAIYPQERSLPPQHLACPQRWNLKARALQFDQDRQQDEAPTCFWLSCVCIGQQSGSKKLNSTLVTMCMPRHQPRLQSFACQKHLPSSQPTCRMCLSTVSLQIQLLLQDSKTWWA
jgi:hypothetical protein